MTTWFFTLHCIIIFGIFCNDITVSFIFQTGVKVAESQRVCHLVSDLKKKQAPDHYHDNYPPNKDAQGSDFAPGLRDLSQSEELSQIKSPLGEQDLIIKH